MASSITAGADAIATALTSAGVRSTTDPRSLSSTTGKGPPLVVIFGNGTSDVRGLGKAGIVYEYRLACVGSSRELGAGDSLTALRTLTALVVGAMRDLAGYAFVSLGPESEGDFAGQKYLAADVIVSTYVAI